MAFDLIVRGGIVHDGNGSTPVLGDVGIRDGVIQEIGHITGNAVKEIDAEGNLLTPGFVDIHTHYDGQVCWDKQVTPSSWHGVTTVVMGNCGVGFAPVRPTDKELLVQLMEGVEDIPGVVLQEGLPWAWETFDEYLDYLEPRHFDMDIGAQIPHAAVRVYVMGERGANREPATAEDIDEMRRITEAGIRAGALGFTSSRTLNHRSSTGAPTPSLQAELDELLGIAQGVRDAGRGVLEMISDFDGLDEEFSFLQQMTERAGCPMSISLAQGLSPNGWRKILGKIEQANAKGLTMRGQVAPRAIGILLGLTTTLSPFTSRPSYAALNGLSLEEKCRALADPERREAILSEPVAPGFARLFKLMDEGRKLWELDAVPNYEPSPETSIAARAAQFDMDPFAYAYERMLANDGKTVLYTPFANYADNDLECCRDMILHEHTVMGLGDGGAHVGTICDASFVTTLLTHWGRDRTRGEQIDLPTLVRNQARDTARAVGLTDRGVIAPGMKADLNVIDFDNLNARAPEIVHDLPAGGARLQQKADGYLATIVSGEVTYRAGEPTDALPGRLIRPR